MLFFTLYSLGPRLGEGLALTVADIDAQRMRVHVRDAKGNRDRLVPLPNATLRWRMPAEMPNNHPATHDQPDKAGPMKAHTNAPTTRPHSPGTGSMSLLDWLV